jgi:Cd2+/Zn2+-exporting ATPase
MLLGRETMKKYDLVNLCCAHCAATIEEELKREPKVRFASVNIAAKSLAVDTDDINLVRKIISRIEPDVKVREHNDKDTRDERYPIVREIILFSAALTVFAMGWLGEREVHPLLNEHALFFYIAVWLMAGWRVLYRAANNVMHARIFDENFLMTISTIGAFVIGAYSEGAAVMLFFKIGEFFQEMSVDRSRRSIRALLSIRPDSAHLLRDGNMLTVPPDKVIPGDMIVVKPGERVPLDGEITEGSSWIDTSALTGESMPREALPGMTVLSGSINGGSALTIRVSRPFAESAASRILALVEDATARKAKTESFISTFAKYYTPVVVVLAACVALIPPFIFDDPFSGWIYRAFVLLVIACPCALVVSIPLGYFGGIGGASRKGILVKGSAVIDALAGVTTVVFDKTGTLTKGLFSVREVVPDNGFSADEILLLAAEAEIQSNHPIALSMRKAVEGRINAHDVTEYTEFPGYGVIAQVKGRRVLVGNDRMLHREGIDHRVCCVDGTVIHVALDGTYAGYVRIADEPKDDAKHAVDSLHAVGIRVVMLTGDSSEAAASIADKTGIDEFIADLLPGGKVEALERIMSDSGGRVAFAGDGINDAPVIARADVGIAMGKFGSDAAIESADVVLMTDAPSRIPLAVAHSRKTRRIVFMNIIFALGVKFAFTVLGIAGIATMWEAVFADVGVTLLAVANSMRAMRTRI